LKNGNRKPTNKRVKEYHNVIKQERKPGPLDHPDGVGGMVYHLAAAGKMVERPISGIFLCFLFVKFIQQNSENKLKTALFEKF
jgi:hypothetical protein